MNPDETLPDEISLLISNELIQGSNPTMKIWLINSAEPTPIDAGHNRLRRMGILADLLVDHGHEVLWWNSTFRHNEKEYLFDSATTIEINPKYRIRFLHAPKYRKNISLQRIRNHVVLAKKFRLEAENALQPDLILSSFPTIELCHEAVRYGHKYNVPTVLDIRDLWPDLFLDRIPPWARGLGRAALASFFRLSKLSTEGATAICGNTEDFVQWGLDRAGRNRRRFDRAFPFGYAPLELSTQQETKPKHFWHQQGVGLDPDVPIACFFGVFSHQFDFDTILKAAEQVQRQRRMQFVLCGKGEYLEHYRALTAGNPDIVLPGWIDSQEIWTLMQLSKFGLAPYRACENFFKNVANKPIEYLAGGLPILSSLPQGALFQLIEEHSCGVNYDGSASTLARALLMLDEQPQQYELLANNARKLFSQRFEATQVYGGMIRHLEAIVANYADRYTPARAA